MTYYSNPFSLKLIKEIKKINIINKIASSSKINILSIHSTNIHGELSVCHTFPGHSGHTKMGVYKERLILIEKTLGASNT